MNLWTLWPGLCHYLFAISFGSGPAYPDFNQSSFDGKFRRTTIKRYADLFNKAIGLPCSMMLTLGGPNSLMLEIPCSTLDCLCGNARCSEKSVLSSESENQPYWMLCLSYANIVVWWSLKGFWSVLLSDLRQLSMLLCPIRKFKLRWAAVILFPLHEWVLKESGLVACLSRAPRFQASWLGIWFDFT